MKKNRLGKTNIDVTELGIGSLSVGPPQLNLPPEEGGKVLKYALEQGLNFIDTAEYYRTYPHIKYALEKASINYPPIICSKSLVHSYSQMKQSVEYCINSLGLHDSPNHGEYIDIFLLHEIRTSTMFNTSSDFESRAGAWEYLKEARSKGIIKAIGISTHHTDVAFKMSNCEDCDVVFPLINFAGLGIRKNNTEGTRKDMEKAIEKLHQTGKGIFTMKAFGGGPLINDYVKALKYNTRLKGVSSTIIGFGSKYDVDTAIQFSEGTLPNDYVPNTTGKKIRIETGSCEGCGKCVSRCPNDAIKLDENTGIAKIQQKKCMACGYCAPVCPVRALIYY